MYNQVDEYRKKVTQSSSVAKKVFLQHINIKSLQTVQTRRILCTICILVVHFPEPAMFENQLTEIDEQIKE